MTEELLDEPRISWSRTLRNHLSDAINEVSVRKVEKSLSFLLSSIIRDSLKYMMKMRERNKKTC